MQGLDLPVNANPACDTMHAPNWRTNEGFCSLKQLDAGVRVICNGVQLCGFPPLHMFEKDRLSLLLF